MSKFACLSIAALMSTISMASAADVSQDAIDGCIDAVRAQVGGGGGTVLSTEFSEANSLVMLRDASGTEWKCLVGNDGQNPYLEQTGSSSSAAAGEPASTKERIQFRSGSTGTDVSGTLSPGSSKSYVLGASAKQQLYVEFWTTDPSIEYQVFHPDGSLLMPQTMNTEQLQVETFLSGDHVIEVINRSNADASYNMSVTVQ